MCDNISRRNALILFLFVAKIEKWKKFLLLCEYSDEYCSSEWFNVFKDMKIHFNLFRIICMNWEKLTDKNVLIYFLMVRYNERNNLMMFMMFDILMNHILFNILHRAMYQNQHSNSIINNELTKKSAFFKKDLCLIYFTINFLLT